MLCLIKDKNVRSAMFIIILSSFIVAIHARPQETEQRQDVQAKQDDEDAYIPYDYKYNVENPPTNTFFGHNENNNVGPTGANGSYYVLLADGRTMVVEYFVDGKSGFVPRISYRKDNSNTNGTVLT